MDREYDVVVVGSGFGGSVAALRAAEKGYRVCVLEAGRRFAPGDFPRSTWRARRFLWAPRLGCRGIQRITPLRDVVVLSGAGVGGGSLVYANVLYEPLEPFFRDPQWSGIADWRAELAPHYETVRRMLGATEVPFESEAEHVVRRVALRMGAAGTFRRTTVAVDFDRCVRCGGCMVGCRYGAKNTLDRTYLRRAEELGAAVHAERRAVLLRRAHGGWELVTERPGAWLRRRRRTVRAREVVLAAGVLGTLELLFRSGLGGPRVGELVRTNSEALVGGTASDTSVDYSAGIAIGSSFFPSADTHVEPVRYPRGSNAMALLSAPLVESRRELLALALRSPRTLLRSLSPRRWSERTVILLVMQAVDNALRIGWTGRRLTTSGGTAPARIPAAHEAARHAAEVMGGLPGASVAEVLFRRPMTAHILGGCCIGDSAATGVVDAYHRVYAEPGLHVVDGSAVGANLGVNPSLTIAALAERALAHWPRQGEPDARPALGEPYRSDATQPSRA